MASAILMHTSLNACLGEKALEQGSQMRLILVEITEINGSTERYTNM